jgi:sugar phosphate permease
MTNNNKKVFYGWWIVLVSMLGISTGMAPFVFASLGLFMLPLQQEFGWDRAQISAIVPIMIVSFMFTQPLVGRLIDRVGTRKVLIPSHIAFGLGLAAIPLFVSELMHLALIFLFLGTCGVAANTMPYLRTVSAWFDRKRGLAIGIAVSGIGLGYAYVPLLVQSAITAGGWRFAYGVLSAIVLFITVPMLFLLLKESPSDMGLMPDNADNNRSPVTAAVVPAGMSSSMVIRRREFWLLSLIFLCIAFVLHGILLHMVPLLRDKGISPGSAAAIASFTGVTTFVSRIVIGYLIDYFFAPRLALIFFALSSLGFFLFATTSLLPLMYLAAFMIGLSLGAEIDLLAYLCGKYFGLGSFGEIYALLFIGVLAGSAIGPVAFGYSFDAMGSYTAILTLSVIINMVALLGTAMLGPYPETTGSTAAPEM